MVEVDWTSLLEPEMVWSLPLLSKGINCPPSPRSVEVHWTDTLLCSSSTLVLYTGTFEVIGWFSTNCCSSTLPLYFHCTTKDVQPKNISLVLQRKECVLICGGVRCDCGGFKVGLKSILLSKVFFSDKWWRAYCVSLCISVGVLCAEHETVCFCCTSKRLRSSAVTGMLSVYVFCSAGLFVVGDICGSGCPQQEQANPVLPSTPRVSLTCESIYWSMQLLKSFYKLLKI